jgi:hypothetical protein
MARVLDRRPIFRKDDRRRCQDRGRAQIRCGIPILGVEFNRFLLSVQHGWRNLIFGRVLPMRRFHYKKERDTSWW